MAGMRSLDALAAVRRIRDRTVAASGLEMDELRQGVEIDTEPDVLLRRLLADVMRPEDLDALLADEDGLLMEITTEFLSAVVPEVLKGCQALDMDGEPLEGVQLVFQLSPALGGMAYTAVGQHIAVGLLMRREGEDEVPVPAPADLDKPSHGGRPDA